MTFLFRSFELSKKKKIKKISKRFHNFIKMSIKVKRLINNHKSFAERRFDFTTCEIKQTDQSSASQQNKTDDHYLWVV